MTFARDIEEAAGEPIESVVIGDFGWGGYGADERDEFVEGDLWRGRVLPWDDARPLLDYAYHTGFGAPDCHAITAWSEHWVLWVTQYDGSTRVNRAPRNPVDHDPEMPGG